MLSNYWPSSTHPSSRLTSRLRATTATLATTSIFKRKSFGLGALLALLLLIALKNS